MKKKYIHHITIETEGFYLFEGGVGFYHAFSNILTIKLEPKWKGLLFYALALCITAFFVALHLIWEINLWLCILLTAMYLLVLFRAYQNRFMLVIKDTNGKHVYHVKSNAMNVIDKIIEVISRVKSDKFEMIMNDKSEIYH